MEYLLFLGLAAGELLRLPIFNSGGVILLDISLVIFGLASLLKYHRFKSPPFSIKVGVVFVVISLLSQLFSPLSLSFNERLIGVSYIIRFLLYLAAGFLISMNFFQLKKNTLQLLLSSGITLAILGLLQLIFIPNLQFLVSSGWDPHYFRTVSTFLDPNFAGAFFGLTLIVLYLFKPFSKRIFLVVFSLLFIALLTTFSRGSYLLFGVSFLTISLLTRSTKTLALTTILTAILIVGFL